MQIRAQRKNLASLTLILFIQAFINYITFPVIYHLLMDTKTGFLASSVSFGQRQLLYFSLVVLLPICKMISVVFIASYSDRYSRKTMLLFCFLLTVFGFAFMILSVFSASLTLLIAARAILGVADCSMVVAKAAIPDFTAGRKRTQYFAIFLCSYALAMAVAPHFGSFLSNIHLVSWFDYTTPLWIGLTLALFNFVLLLEFFRDADIKRDCDVSLLQIFDLTQKLWENIALRHFLMVIFLLNIVGASYFMNDFLFLSKQLNFNAMQLGVFTSLTCISIAIGSIIVLPLLMHKIHPQNILRGILLFLVLLSLFFPLPIVWVQWTLTVIMGICVGVCSPIYTAMLANAYPDKKSGFIMGWLGVLLTLTWLLALVLPSLLASISPYLIFVLFIIVLSIIAYIACKKINFLQFIVHDT